MYSLRYKIITSSITAFIILMFVVWIISMVMLFVSLQNLSQNERVQDIANNSVKVIEKKMSDYLNEDNSENR